jgi:hypothetical protein
LAIFINVLVPPMHAKVDRLFGGHCAVIGSFAAEAVCGGGGRSGSWRSQDLIVRNSARIGQSANSFFTEID